MKKVILVLVGVAIGALGYIGFDNVLTPDATVIESIQGEILLEGTFVDADAAHRASGAFTIVGDGMGGRSIMLSNNFEVANAPDPVVKINGELIAKTFWKGGQVFNIPNFIEEDIESVVIWCEIADVPLAHSRFK